MRILIANDDGIEAEGIVALYDALRSIHKCVVVAPDGERSAFSHSISIHSDLFYRKTEIGYAVSGTPADCVKLGILHLLDTPPDVVISGINNGSNLGSDIMYSGTVSAAMEAAYLGVRGIAISLSNHNADSDYYARAAKLLCEMLDTLLSLPLSADTVLNVNYPVRAPFAGVRFTKAGINLYNDTFVAGERDGGVRLKGVPVEHDGNPDDCDVELIKKGFVTVTPLRLDRNDYDGLARLQHTDVFNRFAPTSGKAERNKR